MKTFFAIAAIALSLISGVELKNHKAADFINHDEIATLNIAIDAVAMDKNECLEAASTIYEDETIIGMSVDGIAKEIYAHVAIHNIVENLPNCIKNNSLVSRINNSTVNGIDLEDYGDTYLRRFAYNVIWVFAN
ncbi:MAG: hypothetical protein MJ153_08140 [Clostridia bacterium]|nr:hypothetical protein [Clostridia bacterium]